MKPFALYWVLALGILSSFSGSTQSDPTDSLPIGAEWSLDDWPEETDGVQRADWLEEVFGFRKDRLDLNRAGGADLMALGILEPQQVASFLEYRNRYGPLIELYELQAVPGLDLAAIRRLLPLVGLQEEGRLPFPAFRQILRAVQSELTFRYGGNWPVRPMPDYLGPSDQFAFRFSGTATSRIKWSLNAEKDGGEPWMNGSFPFDFRGGYLLLKDPLPGIRRLCLGDHYIHFGQGLLLSKGGLDFTGPGPESQIRPLFAFRPKNGFGEAGFFRGIFLESALSGHLSLQSFFSAVREDGRIAQDSVSGQKMLLSFSQSGYHRTAAEQERKKNLPTRTWGWQLKYNLRGLSISFQGLYDQLAYRLSARSRVYQLFDPIGKFRLGHSLSWNYQRGHWVFFGECIPARSSNRSGVVGVLTGLGSGAGTGLTLRILPRNNPSRHGNGPGRASDGNREEGLFWSLRLRPFSGWTFDFSADLWSWKWLRYRRDSPSVGHRVLLQLSGKRRGRWNCHLRLSLARDQTNRTLGIEKFRPLEWREQWRFRFHIEQLIQKGLRVRHRLEGSRFQTGTAPWQTGVLLYQEWVYDPLGNRLSGSTRLALFQTGGYDSRIYAYERALRRSFAIPAFSGQGLRWYVLLKYRVGGSARLGIRLAQTVAREEPREGKVDWSGRWDWSVQFRWSW